jgi:hypothetical protein
MNAYRLALLASLAVPAVGCALRAHHSGTTVEAGDAATASEPIEGGAGTPPLSDAQGNLTHDAATGTDAEPDASPQPSCAPGADMVYVASEENNLYSFDPKSATFSLLGRIDCANGAYVNSMAIDRTATAWINYADGSLWKAGTHNPTCEATGFIANQQGVGMFGMGFAAKSPGGTEDTLFIDDLSGGGLGFIDLSTMTLQRFGPFSGTLANGNCELTGNANAQLYGFFAGSPFADSTTASVAAIDINTEAASQQWMLPTVDTGSDWAFVTWGGDFYLFTADKYDMTDPFTTVTRFRPSDGSLQVVAQNIGFRVVGAGTSTCAPTISSQ